MKVEELPWSEVTEMPVPGMMMVARRSLKSWENDRERGINGVYVNPGDKGILVQSWREGNRIRLRVLINDQLLLFSHANHTVWLNWAFGTALETQPADP